MTTEHPKLVLVGELNPWGTDPTFALYPLPPHASGGRLRRILGLRRSEYIDLTRRYNLCTGRWSISTARVEATRLLGLHTDQVLVLLGRKVARAFGMHASDDADDQLALFA